MFCVSHGLAHGQTRNTPHREVILSGDQAVQHFLKMRDSEYYTDAGIFHVQIGKRVDARVLRTLQREYLVRMHNLSAEDLEILRGA